MPNRVAKERLYLTSDGQRVVREGDPEAASLFVAAGLDVTDADVKKYKLEKYVEGGPEPYDAIADHDAKHAGETDQEAAVKHQAMLDGQPDPDGPPAPGERGDVEVTFTPDSALEEAVEGDETKRAADAPPATKAVTKAPSNKSKG